MLRKQQFLFVKFRSFKSFFNNNKQFNSKATNLKKPIILFKVNFSKQTFVLTVNLQLILLLPVRKLNYNH